MSFATWADAKAKKLGWIDVALVKLSCLTLGIILAALIPKLLEINVWWLVVLFVILAVKPVYKVFVK